MKNQLFRNTPDLNSINKIIKLFGLKDINDNHSFTKENLKELKTADEMEKIMFDLQQFYLPCKMKYITNINEKKCITILRQFLKCQNFTLNSKEKYVKGNKYLFYQIIPQDINMLVKNREKEKVIISFD
jgi:hypothetical protein